MNPIFTMRWIIHLNSRTLSFCGRKGLHCAKKMKIDGRTIKGQINDRARDGGWILIENWAKMARNAAILYIGASMWFKIIWRCQQCGQSGEPGGGSNNANSDGQEPARKDDLTKNRISSRPPSFTQSQCSYPYITGHLVPAKIPSISIRTKKKKKTSKECLK